MNTITRTLAELDPQIDASIELSAHDEELLRVIMELPLPASIRTARTRARHTLVVAGAVAATVTLGLAQLGVGGHDIGASPAAAAILERAADVTIKTSDPVVGPGQYLRITTVERRWTSPMDLSDVGSDGRPLYYETLDTEHIWVPYDRDDVWVFDEKSVVTDRVSTDSPRPGSVEEAHHTWTAKGGRSTNWHEHTRYEDPDWWASLPRDPDTLLKELLAAGPPYAPVEHDAALDQVVTPILTSGFAPADIRAALFRALARDRVVEIGGGVEHVDGRPAVAIRMGYVPAMLFDRSTGQYIGRQARSTDFPVLPQVGADEPTTTTIVRTDVVDEAPGQE